MEFVHLFLASKIYHIRRMLAKSSLKTFNILRQNISKLSPIVRNIHGTRYACSNFHPIASHRDTPDNTPATYFDFTPENYKRVINIDTIVFPKIYHFNVYFFTN